MKFKVGDKVKILLSATSVGVEREEVGKVGVITRMENRVCEDYGIGVKMNEVCETRGYIPTWNVGEGMIVLSPQKNEQLVFDFMER